MKTRRKKLVVSLLFAWASCQFMGCTRSNPLHEAVLSGDPDEFQRLARGGADMNTTDDDGMTPLRIAAKRDDLIAAAILIEAGAEIMADEKRAMTPLHFAVRQGNEELVIFLIAKGADATTKSKDAWTLLFDAALFDIRAFARMAAQKRLKH